MIDVFRVGVHLGMSGNYSQFLGLMSRDLLHVHDLARNLETQMGRVKLAVGGAVTAFAGVALAKGVWHTIDAAKELNAELNRTARLGGNLAIDPAKLRAEAYKVANEVRTIDPAGAVKLEREIAGQVNDHDKAFKILPMAAKVAYNLEQYTGADADTAVRDAVKASDLWGNIFTKAGKDGKEEVDTDKLTAAMDMFSKGIVASGGLLKMSDYVAFMKQAGLSGKNMTPEGIAWMTEAMVAMGPSRAGTASSSLFQQFQAGVAPGYDWRNLAAHSGGAFKEGRDFSVGKGGHTTITDQGRKDLHVDEMKNQPKWVNDVLIPMLEKGGVKEQDLLTTLTQILGRQTTQRLVGEAFQNRAQFGRTADVAMHSKGTDESFQMLEEKDLGTNLKELDAAWKGFMTALGEPGIPLAITALKGMTDGLHMMTDWIVKNPDIAEKLLKMAAGVSGMLIVLGGAAMLAAIAAMVGPAGLIVGLAGLAGGIVWLANSLDLIPGWFRSNPSMPTSGLDSLRQSLDHHVTDGTLSPKAARAIFDREAKGYSDQARAQAGLPKSNPLAPEHVPVVPPPPPQQAASDPDTVQKVFIVNSGDHANGVTAAQVRAASRAATTGASSLDRSTAPLPGYGGQ